jgi:DNA-binding transcriptional ArsR family regulator
MSKHPAPSPSPDAAFAALADPTRRAILGRLAQGEATVAELAAPFTMSQPAISRHLRVLEDAGLIDTRVAGTARPRRLNPAGLRLAYDWLAPFRAHWEDRFDRLDALLDDLARENEKDPRP